MNEDLITDAEEAAAYAFKCFMEAEPGSEESRISAENAVKLSKVVQDESQNVKDEEERAYKQKYEEEQAAEEALNRQKQYKRETILGYGKLGVELLAVILPPIVTVVWLGNCLEVETHDAITSTATKWLMNRIRLTK